jgi:hypothetical protein
MQLWIASLEFGTDSIAAEESLLATLRDPEFSKQPRFWRSTFGAKTDLPTTGNRILRRDRTESFTDLASHSDLKAYRRPGLRCGLPNGVPVASSVHSARMFGQRFA